MAEQVECSGSVRAEACAGKKLPIEAVVVVFVTSLCAGPAEIECWSDRLQVVKVVPV